MAQEITPNAKAVVEQTSKTLIMALEIEGIPFVYGSAPIKKTARYGDPELLYGKLGFVYGGLVERDDSRALIDLDGTTRNLTQQMNQDNAEITSTANFTVSLVDKNQEISDLIKQLPNDDILSKIATIRIGLDNTSYPEDFIKVFVGNISDVSADQGSVKFTMQHPEGRKDAVPFIKQTTELVGNLGAAITTVPVQSTAGFLTSSAEFRTLIRIDDELIEYTNTPGATEFTSVTRGAFGTQQAPHDDEAAVESFYLLGDDSSANGNAIELALRLMLSDGVGGAFASDTVSSFVNLGLNGDDENSIYFNSTDVADVYGVTPGDTFSIIGATNPSNNVTDIPITSITSLPDGSSYIFTATQSYISEIGSGATISFKSQYNNLPSGLAMTPLQVDVPEFQRIMDLFGSSIPNVLMQIADDLTGKDIINNELLLVSGAYNIPRKGKISLAKFSPPLAIETIPTINENTCLNASKLRVQRSTNKNFFNNVVFKYSKDPISGKFTRGLVTSSATSFSKIPKKGNVIRKFESDSLTDTTDTQAVLNRISTAILDRFKVGAEELPSVIVPFRVGWNIDVGDAVIVEGLQLTDTKKNKIGLDARVFEVTNKSMSLTTSTPINLRLLDTGFSLDGRFGVISPSSNVAIGSTTTNIVIERSFGTEDYELEKDKWEEIIGRPILVHSPDYSFAETVTLTGFDPGNDNIMQVFPALSSPPPSGYIVDSANYDNVDSYQKAAYVHIDPSVSVTGGSSNTVFTVSDPSVFFVGSILKVHDTIYTTESVEATVTDVTGSTITVDTNLGFTPVNGQIVELIGFVSDEGLPYRIF